MKEDDDMLNAARVSKGRTEGAADAQEGVSSEALERLDRLASASVLAAGLAHEIASPLGALLGALDSIERRVRELRRSGAAAGRDVDELAEELEIASESTGAITDLVHDFQSFLRAAPEADATAADVRQAVERALRLARARLRAVAHVEVELLASPRVNARGSRIVQVVLNLLLNALEALAGRARAENRITVRVDVAAGRALIEVSDNGPGLPRDIGERVFEAALIRRAGRASAGLGLPISRELVRKMGGEITVSSLPGAGTTFLVSLPPAQ
jgi:two-component system, NtrC family, sensor kinase